MRSQKPSSGLVHLHKSFVELQFAGRALPQNVAVQACVDGKQLATVLPGQVYSTSCGADHWLLGLQLIFKAYKDPVITHVEKTCDNEITVEISTQGIQDKYHSDDAVRRAELQQQMEAAALKFAQAAILRKEGRLQIMGPNINIPKKQLRAQWPAVLERMSPQDVQAHIFIDSADQYISCAAKIILTKAKAEPVFYLSGLSQLLKSYTGAFVTLELHSSDKVVRLNIDTGNKLLERPSLSTTAALTPDLAGDLDSAATPPARRPQLPAATPGQAVDATAACAVPAASAGSVDGTSGAPAAGTALEGSPNRTESQADGQRIDDISKRSAGAVGAASTPQSKTLPGAGLASASAGLAAVFPANHGSGRLRPSPSQQLLLWKEQHEQLRLQYAAAAPAAEDPARILRTIALQQQQQQQQPALGLLEGMCSSNCEWYGTSIDHQPPHVGAVAGGACVQSPWERTAEVLPGTSAAELGSAAADVGKCVDGSALPGTVGTRRNVSVGSEAGLWLLADHAAQLQAVGSCGNIAGHHQHSQVPGPTSSSSCSKGAIPARPPPRGSNGAAGGVQTGTCLPPDAAAKVAMRPAAGDSSIHPAALPQGHFDSLVGKQQRGRAADTCHAAEEQSDVVPTKRRKISTEAPALQLVPTTSSASQLSLAQTSGQQLGLDLLSLGANSLAAAQQGTCAHGQLAYRQQQESTPVSIEAGWPAADGKTAVMPGTLDPAAAAEPVGKQAVSAASLLAAVAALGTAELGTSSGFMYLAQQGALQNEGGAVAVVQRVGSQQRIPYRTKGGSQSQQKVFATDWSPGQHHSPKSGASSMSRYTVGATSSIPNGSSPAVAALAAGGPAVYAMDMPYFSGEVIPASSAMLGHHDHQQTLWQHGPGNTGTAHIPQQQLQPTAFEITDGAAPNWPELPDADNLMLVGKGLVQVMNLLGAGSAARLALTRSLRMMSSQDREWLLSITYPHLQDSCKRRALPEVKMILDEITGIDCFAHI